MMGWLQRIFDRILMGVREERVPQIVFLPDLATWVVENTRELHKKHKPDYPSEISQTKHVRSCMEIAQLLQSLDLARKTKEGQLRISRERLHSLIVQKDEREVTLLKAKDTSEYQLLFASFEDEKELVKKQEMIDDELFLFLVRIKTSLTELQDFNSNYELLDVINAVNKVQEKFRSFFEENAYRILQNQLQWVNRALKSGTLREKTDGQYLFRKLFEQFSSGDFVQKREMGMQIRVEIHQLRQARLRQGIYSKIEDLKYRIDHFTEQQNALEMHVSQLTLDAENISVKLKENKIAFERLANQTFGVSVTVAVASHLTE